MVKVIKTSINIDEELRKKIDFICSFTNTTPKFVKGNLIQIERTNLIYFEPHKVIINNITYLFFNNSNEIYIDNLSNKLELSQLENHINQAKKIPIDRY